MKRGDWVRLKWGRTAHLVVAETPDHEDVIRACELEPLPKLCVVEDDMAPRCKKCLKAMVLAKKEQVRSHNV